MTSFQAGAKDTHVHSGVDRLPLPPRSLAASAFQHADYADAFRVRLAPAADLTVERIAWTFLNSVPRWVKALIWIRDRAATVVGLKTAGGRGISAADRPPSFEPGTVVGPWHVYARSETEILLGEDDRHLDFRLSIERQGPDDRPAAVASTVVRFHGWFGRLYFLPVGPLHRLIMPALLRELARRIGDSSSGV